jgi:hypothetical protein
MYHIKSTSNAFTSLNYVYTNHMKTRFLTLLPIYILQYYLLLVRNKEKVREVLRKTA